jgi:hypothetical protein
MRLAFVVSLSSLSVLSCAGCATPRIGDYGLGCDESIGRQISIEMYGGKTGHDPDLSIEQCEERAIARVALLSDDNGGKVQALDMDSSTEARRRRRDRERRRTALASRYGCRVLRASIEFGAEPVATCIEPFTKDGPNWPRLVARLDELIGQRPDSETNVKSALRCIRSGEGRQWVITVWHKRHAESLIVTPRCPSASQEYLRYASRATALLDSIQTLIAQ